MNCPDPLDSLIDIDDLVRKVLSEEPPMSTTHEKYYLSCLEEVAKLTREYFSDPNR